MSLRAALLWVAAVGVTAVVLYRFRSQRVVVLSGRWSPRLVRMVAVLVVAMGLARVEAAEPEAPCAPADQVVQQRPRVLVVSAPLEVPPWLTTTEGLARLGETLAPRGRWATLKQTFARVELAAPGEREEAWRRVKLAASAHGVPAGERFEALADKAIAGTPATLAEVTAVVDAVEAAGVVDAWLVGWAFRASEAVASRAPLRQAERSAVAALYGRLERHARLADAVQRAGIETGPITYRPWLKKSGPPPGWSDVVVPAGMPGAVAKAAKTATAGTWTTEATLGLTVAKAPKGLRLHRQGLEVPLADGARVRFGRLDILQVPEGASALVEIDGLGSVTLPAGGVTAWNVGALLPAEARAKVTAWVEAAVDCPPGHSVRALEAVLPAAQGAIADKLAARPDASLLRVLRAAFID